MMIPTLEQSRAFPFIAWATVAIFCGITVMLVVRFETEIAKLDDNRAYKESLLYESQS